MSRRRVQLQTHDETLHTALENFLQSRVHFQRFGDTPRTIAANFNVYSHSGEYHETIDRCKRTKQKFIPSNRIHFKLVFTFNASAICRMPSASIIMPVYYPVSGKNIKDTRSTQTIILDKARDCNVELSTDASASCRTLSSSTRRPAVHLP